jgi:hypothetical protein
VNAAAGVTAGLAALAHAGLAATVTGNLSAAGTVLLGAGLSGDVAVIGNLGVGAQAGAAVAADTALRNTDVARVRGVLAGLALRGYASLGVTAVASPSVFTHVGQRVAIDLRVTNTGKVALGDIALSSGLNAVTCPSVTLAAGAVMTCDAIATATAADLAAGHIVAVVDVTGHASAGPVVTAGAVATVAANVGIGLRLASQISDNAAGEKITYVDTVTNTGDAPLHGVAVTDDKIHGAFTCDATTLAAGASTTCTSTYTVTGADLAAGHVVNVFTASGWTPAGAEEMVKADPVNFVTLPEVPVAG